ALVDEVSLYNRALSPEEIAATYAAENAGKVKSTPGTVSQIVDYTVNQRHLVAATTEPDGSFVYSQPTLPRFPQIVPLQRDNAFGYALPQGIDLTHLIETSSDMVHWTPLTNVTLYFKDVDSTNFNQRFYRFPGK